MRVGLTGQGPCSAQGSLVHKEGGWAGSEEALCYWPAGWLALRGFLMPPGLLHPAGFVLSLMAQSPSPGGLGDWGFFHLKERSRPSEGLSHLCPQWTGGLGAS